MIPVPARDTVLPCTLTLDLNPEIPDTVPPSITVSTTSSEPTCAFNDTPLLGKSASFSTHVHTWSEVSNPVSLQVSVVPGLGWHVFPRSSHASQHLSPNAPQKPSHDPPKSPPGAWKPHTPLTVCARLRASYATHKSCVDPG
eukprot:CAMPEP_0114114748 /NCGR_PEP_ID=MMETSP0043_2-20121206/3599_1 /TAXON_ID=464988 /ORGANISM="Hemiselmis andersenii, Strain CCMP644" /LENGTH=141 /DNA_ID=CAMNT_0001206961 /DNA_START=202 /DNA_END=623 /DNA_ORIENTATION=-